MFGDRSRYLLVRIVLSLCFLLQVVDGTSWRGFRRVLARLLAHKPILVVLFDFEHALDFHKVYPSQQIIASPRSIHFKICPYPRILVVTGLPFDKFYDAFENRVSRLCPFGTTFVLLDDIQLHAYNQHNLLPFTALNDPMRKGLFYGSSLKPMNWKRYTEPEFPPTWKDEYLKKEAKILNIHCNAATFIYLYEIIFIIGNRSMMANYVEYSYNPALPLYMNPYELPLVGTSSPITLAVFRPQRPNSITDEYSAGLPVLLFTILLSLVLAVFVRISSHQRGSYFSALVFTLTSLVGGVPLQNLRNDVRLLITFGVWLFLSQIFVSILKGEMIKNVSIGPTNKIDSFSACEPNFPNKTLYVEHTYAPKTDKEAASMQLLRYDYVCFFDLMELKPFRTFFTYNFPEAELYPIKHHEIRKKVLFESYIRIRYENIYSPGHVLFRLRICPVRGYFYFRKLMEPGLFDGVKYHHYRVGKNAASWIQEHYPFYKPMPLYYRHTNLTRAIGASVKTSETADYLSWVKFAGGGWIVATAVFFAEKIPIARKRFRKHHWTKLAPFGRFGEKFLGPTADVPPVIKVQQKEQKLCDASSIGTSDRSCGRSPAAYSRSFWAPNIRTVAW